MPSHRTRRVAEAIREVVASAILFEMNDPRIKGVTVINVEVSSDLRAAVVNVSVMGSASEQHRAVKGLEHASGFIQSKVAARLQTRFTPHVRFNLDDSVKKSIAMSRLIDQTLAQDEQTRPNAVEEDETQQSQEESQAEQ